MATTYTKSGSSTNQKTNSTTTNQSASNTTASSSSHSNGGNNSTTFTEGYTSWVGPVSQTTRDNFDKYQQDYQESQKVQDAYQALQDKLNNGPGAFNSQYETMLNDVYNKIMNREDFSYNMNEDALYQQYKDQYTTQGKSAMNDTMASAAALTGGYGSSYTQTAGQQAYQNYLDQLNNRVPELYQMAYQKYKDEGEALNNQFAITSDQYDREYGQYRDEVADYQADRDFLYNNYNDERDFDYNKYSDNRNFWSDQYWKERQAVQKTSSTATTIGTNWTASTSNSNQNTTSNSTQKTNSTTNSTTSSSSSTTSPDKETNGGTITVADAIRLVRQNTQNPTDELVSLVDKGLIDDEKAQEVAKRLGIKF